MPKGFSKRLFDNSLFCVLIVINYIVTLGILINNSIIAGAFNVLTLILSFATNLIIAAKFGSGNDMDLYFTATTIPLYIVTILTNILSITFIPVFSSLKKENAHEAWRIVSIFLNLSIALCVLLIVLGFIFKESIIRITAPGFSESNIIAASNIFVILLPTVLVNVIIELINSIYFAHNKILFPLFIRSFGPILIILFIFVFNSFGVRSIALAFFFSGVIQIAVVIFVFRSNTIFQYKFIPTIYTKEVNSVAKLMLPLIIGMTVYKITPIIDRYLLSSLPSGSISYVNYANKLFLALSQIISASITTASFPLLSQYASECNISNDFRNLITRLIKVLILITIPIVFIVVIDREIIIKLFFERGKFTALDTHNVAQCLGIYILVLPLSCIGSVIAQAFYALKNTIIPVVVGFFEIVLYICISIVLVPRFGFIGVPLVYFIYFLFSVVCLSFLLQRKVEWYRNSMLIHLLKVLMVSVMASIPLVLVVYFKLGIIINITTVAIVVLIFFYLLNVLKINEIIIFKGVMNGIISRIKK